MKIGCIPNVLSTINKVVIIIIIIIITINVIGRLRNKIANKVMVYAKSWIKTKTEVQTCSHLIMPTENKANSSIRRFLHCFPLN